MVPWSIGIVSLRRILSMISSETKRRSHYHRVATMTKRKKTHPSKPRLTPDQIDQFVTAQADQDSAWEKVVSVRRSKSTSLSADLAARAAFIAKLHHES